MLSKYCLIEKQMLTQVKKENGMVNKEKSTVDYGKEISKILIILSRKINWNWYFFTCPIYIGFFIFVLFLVSMILVYCFTDRKAVVQIEEIKLSKKKQMFAWED